MCSDAPTPAATRGTTKRARNATIFPSREAVMDGRMTTTRINRMLAPIKENTTVEGNII